MIQNYIPIEIENFFFELSKEIYSLLVGIEFCIIPDCLPFDVIASILVCCCFLCILNKTLRPVVGSKQIFLYESTTLYLYSSYPVLVWGNSLYSGLTKTRTI